MPTYQVGGVDRADSWQPVPERPLTCEECGSELGSVTAVQPHARMTAAAVRGVFPQARPMVERHEAECPGSKV